MVKKIVKQMALIAILFVVLAVTSLYATGFTSINQVKRAVERYKQKSSKRAQPQLMQSAPSHKAPSTKDQHKKALDYYKKPKHWP